MKSCRDCGVLIISKDKIPTACLLCGDSFKNFFPKKRVKKNKKEVKGKFAE